MEHQRITLPMRGEVRWFDPERGFGFVKVEGVEEDVLLHAHQLSGLGRDGVPAGARLMVSYSRGDRGLRVSKIHSLEEPVAPKAFGVEICSLPAQPARVRWFNEDDGYGFARAWGSEEDVYIPAAVAKAYNGLLRPGVAVSLRQTPGPKGAVAVQLGAWA